jgi:chemotaxis signal transduction protein
MTADSNAETQSNAQPDEMAGEDAIANDSILLDPPTEQVMPATQALITGSDIVASGDMEQPELKQGKPGVVPVKSISRQGFRIGELRFMTRYEDASELSEMATIHKLPNAPEWFCGIANMHGKLTPVFDLARFFGVESDPEVKHMLLVISRGSDATGVLIDGLPERLHCPEDDYTDACALPERLMPHLLGTALIGEQQWFDLDTHSLLGALEQSLGQAK